LLRIRKDLCCEMRSLRTAGGLALAQCKYSKQHDSSASIGEFLQHGLCLYRIMKAKTRNSAAGGSATAQLSNENLHDTGKTRQLDSCCKGEKLCWSKKKLYYGTGQILKKLHDFQRSWKSDLLMRMHRTIAAGTWQEGTLLKTTEVYPSYKGWSSLNDSFNYQYMAL
jgi:hypothetical protein